MKRVLIVDDSKTARMTTAFHIGQKWPGIEIIDAETGEAGIEQVNIGSGFDFILMDINMPGMGGLEASRQIKANHPNVPLFLVTANFQESTRVEAEKIGAAIIEKPFSIEKLLAKLG